MAQAVDSGQDPIVVTEPTVEIALSEAVSPTALGKAHRQLAASARKVRPTDTRLIHDPIDNLAYSLDLKTNLSALSRRVLSGAYVPGQPTTVRIAERNRLRRPIVYCGLEDGLVLGSLIRAIRPAFEKELPDWVSYAGRSRSVPPSEDPYENWFLAFLRYKSRADRIQGNDDALIVVSDIANFFPTVNLELLRDRVQRVGLLDSVATNLLLRMLREFGGAHLFDPFALRGLPQEPDDNSHLLANHLLVDIDERFRNLGETNRFARLSDDMVFSAPDQPSANQIIVSLEEGLAELGLTVNSSKTRVLSKKDFEAQHLPRDNEILESLNAREDDVLFPFERTKFEESARKFVKSRPDGEWDRVLRRYYNTARRFRSPILTRYAWAHIDSYPESAKNILEYVQTMRPTGTTALKLVETAKTVGAHYDDVQIHCYETLLHLPIENRSAIRRAVVDEVRKHFIGDGCDATRSYVASLCLLAMYRFGYQSDVSSIEDWMQSEEVPLDVAKQGYVILRSEGRVLQLTRALPSRYSDPDLWRLAYFFDEMERVPGRVLRAARSWMKPKSSTRPSRQFLRARSLPLYRAFHRHFGDSTTFRTLVEQTRGKLSGGGGSHQRDGLGLARLKELAGT